MMLRFVYKFPFTSSEVCAYQLLKAEGVESIITAYK